ncbi:MAG: heparan-alpha-glucosaminide N-acetyltransferase domain-containing protein [Clostridiales bacterium]|nr:heparan-alpha-glucosaminide N-acetyltransferase domain-containing protein [Clostridiales bacterium]MDY5514365.1 heparan-alpha-glucosaminide N-acetyltransferase domain-containing protein [Candidatus Ventricola sp.]
MKRDPAVDIARGLLVLLMVWGHTMQFFADTAIFPLAQTLIDAINVTVFPTFVFCFGCTTFLSYLQRPYRRALPGLLCTMLRAYAAFVVSGVGYRVLREGKALSFATVRRVALLGDIPGWPEFLIAFALYALLTAVAFGALRRLAERAWLAALAGGVCLLCTLIPYDRVGVTRLALIIGGTQYAFFPIVPYMPYFLAGLVYAAGGRRVRLAMLPLAAAATALGCACWALRGGMPSRFPPDAAWVALSALPVCAVMLLSRALCLLPWAMESLRAAIAHFGTRSLYYLLASNLSIFAFAGRGIVPQYAQKALPPFNLTVQSPGGALGWAAALLLTLWFVSRLAGRGKPAAASNKE